MESIMNVLTVVAIVVIGLIARLGVLVVGAAVLAVPVLLGILLVRSLVRVRERTLGLARVGGLVCRRGLYYAPGHTWVTALNARRLRVGLDDLAQHVLAGVSRVELPLRGTSLREGQIATIVTCGGKRGEIRSPVDGLVVDVNRAVERDPTLIHRKPYTRGWLFTVAPANTRYTRFLRGDAAVAWLSDEKARLAHFVEGAVGMAAADGGDLVSPPPSLLTNEEWSSLTRTFFSAGEEVAR